MGQKYYDIVVGSAAWTDYPKSRDFLFVALGLLFMVSWGVAKAALLRRYLPAKFKNLLLNPTPYAPVLTLAGILGSVVFLRYQLSLAMPWTLLLLVSAAALIWLVLVATQQPIRARALPSFFSAIHCVFGLLGVVCALHWAFPSAVTSDYFWPVALFGCFLFLSGIQITRWMQVLIPLLLLRLPLLSLSQGEKNIFVGPSLLGNALLLMAVAGLCARLVFLLRRQKTPVTQLPALFALGVYFAHISPLASPLWMDDFHLGEWVLPWHQIFEKGLRPYSQFVPIQGWLGFLSGAFNCVFYASNLDSFLTAKAFAESLVGGASALLTARVLGVPSAWLFLLVLPLFPEGGDRLMLLLPFTLLLFDPALIARPGLRFVLWPLLALIHCLYNAPSGIAWTLATLPIAIHSAKQAKRKEAITAAAALGIFVVLFFPWIVGWFRFVKTNGSSNSVAYGLGLFESQDSFSLELVRSGGWICAVALGITLAWFFWRKAARSRSEPALFGVALALLPLLLIPYTLGRLDALVLSRTGVASLVLWGSFGSFACLWALKENPSAPLWAGLLGLCLGYHEALFPTDFEGLLAKAGRQTPISEEYILVKGADFSLPKVGTVFVHPARWLEIVKFRDLLRDFKNPQDSFLDLTNRSLLYYLMDEKCPVPIASDYHAFNESLQAQNLRVLEANPPGLVWLAPSIRHDAGPASLRSYRVYRWLLESGKYSAARRGNFSLLVNAKSNPNGPLEPKPDDEQKRALENIFHREDLLSIPTAWGRNWKNLQDRFKLAAESVNPPTLYSSKQPTLATASMQGGALRKPIGQRPDFLLVEIAGEKAAAGTGTVRFRGVSDKTEAGAFRFNWKPGLSLIPLGSSPEWLLSDAIADVEVQLDSDPAAQIGRLGLYRLTR